MCIRTDMVGKKLVDCRPFWEECFVPKGSKMQRHFDERQMRAALLAEERDEG